MTKLPNSFRPNFPNPMVKVVSQHPIKAKLGPFNTNFKLIYLLREKLWPKERSLAPTDFSRVKLQV